MKSALFFGLSVLLACSLWHANAMGATIQLNPSEGTIGSSVIVTGENFTAGNTVTVDFGPFLIVAVATVAVDGSFQATILSLPAWPAGEVTVQANEVGTEIQATAIFTVMPNIANISPTEVAVGAAVTLTGNGFAANETLEVDFGSTPNIASGLTDAKGQSDLQFTVDNQPAGKKDIIVRGLTSGLTVTKENAIEVLEEAVNIPDARLESVIRRRLGKPTGPLTVDDLASLTIFSASAQSISDLTGLEFAINLSSLNLRHNQISDLLPLVNNLGLGAGDIVDVGFNPLSSTSLDIYIPSLLARGVTVNDPPLPVTLASFTATSSTEGVTLHWRTESEINNLGFHLYRSETKDGDYLRITPTLIKGHGTDSTPHDYSFLDDSAEEDQTYWYLIEDVDFAGVTESSDPIEVRFHPPAALEELSTHFALHQNYPNPFNPETWIPYDLAQDSTVTINIYALQGRLVRTLDLGQKPAGIYINKDRAAYWDGRNKSGERVASGVYVYQIVTPTFQQVKQMAILK